VISQPTCFNKVETSWQCDFDDPWYPYKGTCKKTIRNVKCCSDAECSSNQYCNRDVGCVDKYVLENCPPGKCCVSGGDYKSKECSSGLVCCRSEDSFIGDCRQSCDTSSSQIKNKASEKRGITGHEIAVTPNMNIIFIIGVIIVISVGGILFFVLRKPKEAREELEEKLEDEEEF